MNKNNRPFEVGDFCVTKGHSGVLAAIDDCSTWISGGIDEGVIWIDDSWYLKEDILTIRKPRTGNAESRAIVAMLKKNIRVIKRRCNQFRDKKDDISKMIYFVATQEIALARMLATEAKAMLK